MNRRSRGAPIAQILALALNVAMIRLLLFVLRHTKKRRQCPVCLPNRVWGMIRDGPWRVHLEHRVG